MDLPCDVCMPQMSTDPAKTIWPEKQWHRSAETGAHADDLYVRRSAIDPSTEHLSIFLYTRQN